MVETEKMPISTEVKIRTMTPFEVAVAIIICMDKQDETACFLETATTICMEALTTMP